jgi:hypothetical protein
VAWLGGSAEQIAPAGFGQGFRFFRDLTDQERARLPALRGPWAWVTRAERKEFARSLGLDPDRIDRLAW